MPAEETTKPGINIGWALQSHWIQSAALSTSAQANIKWSRLAMVLSGAEEGRGAIYVSARGFNQGREQGRVVVAGVSALVS